MFEQRTLSYADSVNRQVCEEFSSDLRMLTEAANGVPQDIEKEFSAFFAELKSAADETRELIAQIDALTS